MSNFKYGDKVWAGTNLGEIVSIRKDDDKNICTVRFDNKRLIPPEMDYEERVLKPQFSSGKYCPICKNKYKVVKFNMQVWNDCETCKDTKENLDKNFEKMLDDDGDFFNYF